MVAHEAVISFFCRIDLRVATIPLECATLLDTVKIMLSGLPRVLIIPTLEQR